MSMISSSSRAGAQSPDWHDMAADLGRRARLLYDRAGDNDIDEFALKLAAEKAAKKSKPSVSTAAPSVSGSISAMVPGYSLPKRVPKNLFGALHWRKFKTDPSVITTSLTAAVETNYSFNGSQDPNASALNLLFENFLIFRVDVELYSTQAPGSLGQLPRVYTAIDPLSVSNISTVAAIEDYESCREVTLAPGKKVRRSVMPSTNTSISSSSSAAPFRGWISTTFPGVQWFGFRSIVAATTTATTVINVTQTFWVVYCGVN